MQGPIAEKRRQGTGGRVQTRRERDRVKRGQEQRESRVQTRLERSRCNKRWVNSSAERESRVLTKWERDRFKRQQETRSLLLPPQTINYTSGLQPMISLFISLLLACFTIFYSPGVLLLCRGLLLSNSSFFLSSSLQSTLSLFKRFLLPSQAILNLFACSVQASLSQGIYVTLPFPNPPDISNTEHLHHLSYKEPVQQASVT